MKKILILLCAILMVSCTKIGESSFNFSAEIENTNQKTHLEPFTDGTRAFKVIWDNEDVIRVYGDGDLADFTNTAEYIDNQNQVAKFSGSGVTGPEFKAFFPAEISNQSNRCVFPTTQRYRSRSDGYVYDYPMYAQAINSNHLYFRNLASLIVVRLKGTTGTKIRKIYLREPSTPNGCPVAGEFEVLCSGSTQTNIPQLVCVNKEFTIELPLTTPTTLNPTTPELFYMYVPMGTHRWLHVGVEYQLSGESTWNTVFHDLDAETYGAQSFTFQRSQFHLLDIDLSWLKANIVENVEDITLTPNQSGDTVINTGTALTSTYQSYTFLVDVTPTDVSATQYNDAIQKAIYSEIDPSLPWAGVLVRIDSYNGTPYYQFTIQSQRCQGPLAVNNTRQKFVCVLNASTNTMCIYYLSGNTLKYQSKTTSSSSWITSQDPIPMIGGDQHKVGRYFDGIIHRFDVYNRILTTSEIKTFLKS